MSCGSWCVYYASRGVSGACHSCSYYIDTKRPRFGLGKVDPFKLAEGLTRKKEEERRDKIPLLSDCSNCGKHSLFYDKIHDKFECLDKDCDGSKGLTRLNTPAEY